MRREQLIDQYITDKGGVFDIAKSHKKIQANGKEWVYKATGCVRDVFVSECGNFVIKIPMMRDRLDHNILEFESYRDAPKWCKEHIAKSELLPNGYLIQEYVTVIQANNFFREIGRRESDGNAVIFDCDIFLDHKMQKPEYGFRYQQVFSKSSIFGEAYNEAVAIPKRLRKLQRENALKHFPNIMTTDKFRQIGEVTYINDIEINEDIANECGFTYKSRMYYE